MAGTEWMGLFTAFGLALGFLLQKIPNSSINTKVIPAVITGLMLVKNLLVAAGKLPADAVLIDVAWVEAVFHMPDGASLAFFGSGWIGMVLQMVMQSVIDAALPIGLYSGVKNTRQFTAARAMKRLMPTRKKMKTAPGKRR